MASQREPIAVIGTGYVGLVTAAGFAELGNEVWCVDVDADKVAMLNRGEVPIWEPGLSELVAKHRDRLHFSTELGPALEHARLLFVAVGTPPTYSGDADLSAVNAVVNAMPKTDHHALVMKSTVPVGTGAAVKRTFAEQGKGFAYVSCPEFLKEGAAIADFLNPDRVVVGDDGDWAGDAVVQLYEPLNAPLVRTDIASAEMVKLASNAFLATKISFINEIANVCEETGADVAEVARGMGLDERIGQHFLRPGIGFGGSCLVGEETVLMRRYGRARLVSFADLWRELLDEGHEELDGMIEPDGLEVFSWVPERDEAEFLPVRFLTRRDYEGDIVEVRTEMGRRVRCTPDHPFVVGNGDPTAPHRIRFAENLTERDWLPLAQGHAGPREAPALLPTVGSVEAAGLPDDRVLVGPHPARRLHTVESLRGATLGTASNGASVASAIVADERFWRVVGLYLAGGNTTFYGDTARMIWSFHPTKEEHLIEEVLDFWRRHGIEARAQHTPTSHCVYLQSRLVAAWWTKVLGLGRNSYEQRLPALIWEQTDENKWVLLSGLFEGDGSWSLMDGGPSVIIELGTVSDELADGVMRLLAQLGIVASRRVGRGAKSTKDTHWIRISGADQIEKAIELVPARDRPGVLASINRQAMRTAPTGYRRSSGPAWARVRSVERRPYQGSVYSMEVPASHTFVTTCGLTVSNCFPKDVSALKQLAGNSGYHFQLLTSVIEVNELQKRRVVGKLQKHLGSLVGKRVALLGLAFKANTDDMREASSLVLTGRLQADGARVVAYDPVAEDHAKSLMAGVDFAPSALEALRGADAAVLVTEWPEFAEIDWVEAAKVMGGKIVIDGRNFLDPARVKAAGFAYEGVGRG